MKVTYMFMTLATSLVVLFNCYATADILTKFLQQYFLFFIGCCYTWAIVRWAFIGPLVLLWFILWGMKAPAQPSCPAETAQPDFLNL